MDNFRSLKVIKRDEVVKVVFPPLIEVRGDVFARNPIFVSIEVKRDSLIIELHEHEYNEIFT